MVLNTEQDTIKFSLAQVGPFLRKIQKTVVMMHILEMFYCGSNNIFGVIFDFQDPILVFQLSICKILGFYCIGPWPIQSTGHNIRSPMMYHRMQLFFKVFSVPLNLAKLG